MIDLKYLFNRFIDCNNSLSNSNDQNSKVIIIKIYINKFVYILTYNMYYSMVYLWGENV